MQLGACFAGMAIENSMLGAAHALANPLTAEFGLVHGRAVAMMLPHVIRFNGEEFGDWYVDLLAGCDRRNGFPPPEHGPAGLADFVSRIVAEAGLPQRLSEVGVDEHRLPALASAAAKQWTGTFNPRSVVKPTCCGCTKRPSNEPCFVASGGIQLASA